MINVSEILVLSWHLDQFIQYAQPPFNPINKLLFSFSEQSITTNRITSLSKTIYLEIALKRKHKTVQHILKQKRIDI